jgi:hypothetical protein
MTSLNCVNSKLSDAIYILTVEEGDARSRLARAVPKIKNFFNIQLSNRITKGF